MTRKFFDTAVADAGGGVVVSSFFKGATKADFSAPITGIVETPDPSNNIPTGGEKPLEGDDKKDDKVVDPQTSADNKPTGDNSNQPDPAADKTEPAASDKKDEPTKADPPPPTDWKEVLGKVDKTEVLKHLGLDDFEIGLIDYRHKTGDVTPYLEAKSKDWDKVSDVEIMRHNLRSQYPQELELSEDEYQALMEEEVDARFKLGDAYTDSEKRLGSVKLKTEAAKVRKALKEEQAKFAAPTREPAKDQPAKTGPTNEEIAQFHETINSNPATQSLLKDKRLVIGSEKSPYNYAVEPEKIIQLVKNPQQFWDLFVNEDKTPNLPALFEVIAYAIDSKNFKKAQFDHGVTVGKDEVLDKLQNPDKKDTAPGAGKEPASEASALMRNATIGTMGG
jgi:hypothetical protein